MKRLHLTRVRARLDAVGTFVRRHCQIIVIVTVGLLILTELILGLFVVPTYPAVEVTFDRGNRNCIRPVPDSSKTFHKHGLISRAVEHRVNNLGFRGPLPAPEDDLVIAVVGNGIVYGTGLNEDSTLSGQLEARLKTAYPGLAVRVLNLGFPDFNLEEQSVEFRRLASEIKPDIVLILTDDTSFLGPQCTRAALPVREFLQTWSALARFLEIKMSGSPLTDVRQTFALPPTPMVMGHIFRRFAEGAPDAEIILATLTEMHMSTDRVTSSRGYAEQDQTGRAVSPDEFFGRIGITFADLSSPNISTAGRRLRSLYSEEDLNLDTVAGTTQRLFEVLKPFVQKMSAGGAESTGAQGR